MTNLTTNQRKAVETIDRRNGATAREIADVLGYSSVSGVYDLLRRAAKRDPTYIFDSDNEGVWTYDRVAADGGTAVETHRVPTAHKQSITKAANDFLSELEVGLRTRLLEHEPLTADLVSRTGGIDMVMFRTDDHIGSTETGVGDNGEKVETFNTDMAVDRVYQHLSQVLSWKRELEEQGYTTDTVHLLMNGDHVTGEDIYPGQGIEIDRTLREQVRTGSELYIDVIRTLADEFPSVQVVCQHGNHGELRTGSQSSEANADDLMYDAVDLALRQSDLTNVRYVTNHVDTHTEFSMRGHRGYMRHGQDTLGHIGTSSGEKRWQGWLLESIERNADTGWDVGYVGHYHELKWEPVAGRPVLMGGTTQPAGDYENSLGIAPGRPGAWTHTVSDNEPIDLIRPLYFK